jgi:hypothetical protein
LTAISLASAIVLETGVLRTLKKKLFFGALTGPHDCVLMYTLFSEDPTTSYASSLLLHD